MHFQPFNFHLFVFYTFKLFYFRRCKLTTTGPWLLVTPTVKLRDVSVQIDQVSLSDQVVSVWVVTSQGDVLYRHGVTKSRPQVISPYK